MLYYFLFNKNIEYNMSKNIEMCRIQNLSPMKYDINNRFSKLQIKNKAIKEIILSATNFILIR